MCYLWSATGVKGTEGILTSCLVDLQTDGLDVQVQSKDVARSL